MKKKHSFKKMFLRNKCGRCGKPAAAHFGGLDTGAPEWLKNLIGAVCLVFIFISLVGLAAMFGG